MSLPDRDRAFYFEYKDEFGNLMEGQFAIKCRLTMRERHLMELEKSRILGGHQNPTNGLMGISVMVATLNAHVKDAPNWWKQCNGGMDLEDENIVVSLFDRVTDEQLGWREELIKKAQASTETVEDTVDEEEGTLPGNGSAETK